MAHIPALLCHDGNVPERSYMCDYYKPSFSIHLVGTMCEVGSPFFPSSPRGRRREGGTEDEGGTERGEWRNTEGGERGEEGEQEEQRGRNGGTGWEREEQGGRGSNGEGEGGRGREHFHLNMYVLL